jgi:hypothetical protein
VKRSDEFVATFTKAGYVGQQVEVKTQVSNAGARRASAGISSLAASSAAASISRPARRSITRRIRWSWL